MHDAEAAVRLIFGNQPEHYSSKARIPWNVSAVSMSSMGTKIASTILVSVGWFAFIVLYLAFYAESLNIWQKVAVFLASGAIATGLIAVFWVKWTFKQR